MKPLNHVITQSEFLGIGSSNFVKWGIRFDEQLIGVIVNRSDMKNYDIFKQF